LRKGSTPLGSLGVIPAGIALLILPLCVAVAKDDVTPTPLPAANPAELPVSTPAPSPSASVATPVLVPAALRARSQVEIEGAKRDALKRRAKQLASLKIGLSKRAVRVIHTGATWYGPGFHGRRTASGERFNRYAMTLASRHLPLGTMVRVINPKTGRFAIARVNDRGPFGKSGYTVDLSQGLAGRIGLLGNGRVRLEVLGRK
jgi:rare lipoprotein A